MTALCAWCTAFLGPRDPIEDTATTHGICEDCARRVRRTVSLRELLNMPNVVGGGSSGIVPPQKAHGENDVPGLSPLCGAGAAFSTE